MASAEETTTPSSLKDNIRSFVSEDILTKALRNYLHDDTVQLDDFHVDLATEEVQGFLSCMLRVKLFYQRDGKQQVKSVIVKRMPISNVQTDMAKDANVFEKENKTYSLIIKDMEVVSDKMGLKIPVPECYYVLTDGKNDMLILEDLCDYGFKIRTHREKFDKPHFDLAVKALATFHALSVAVEKQKGQVLNEVYDCLTESMFTPQMYKAMPFFDDGIKGIVAFAKLMPEYEKIIPELQKQCDLLWKRITELIKPGDTLNAVLHGDTNCQNFMFRYENERPVEVKIIDLQIVRYGSPVLDLLAVFYGNSLCKRTDEHADEMLSIYHSQFSSVLKGAGVEVHNFSLEDLRKEYHEKRIYGVFMACLAVPFLYMSEDILPKNYEDTDDFVKMFNESQTAKQVYLFKTNPEYRGLVEAVVTEMVEVMGLLK